MNACVFADCNFVMNGRSRTDIQHGSKCSRQRIGSFILPAVVYRPIKLMV